MLRGQDDRDRRGPDPGRRADDFGWWSRIPTTAKVMTALVAAVLVGVALAGWIQLPTRVDRLDQRVKVLEQQFDRFVRTMDRWACVQLAEAEGRPIRTCL